ncbi:CcdB family protein [Sphingomonas sp. M1-B02]|uniref:CcdB family protein n=1 Tax=Sphingomonas sp. M1-B02 TaxID=3114300 RepID=UPI00223FEB09|nr:CcdB family protein [Sphingomonas sp. S6-11]UZK65537.1 CcdB family protein [Sphingomonas sp. S6-11]
MAQFDVHRAANGTLLVDCQADTLSHLNTRLVVPLLPVAQVPPATDRLHPILMVDGSPFVLAVQMTASIPARELSRPIESLAADRYTIVGAVDLLLTGV